MSNDNLKMTIYTLVCCLIENEVAEIDILTFYQSKDALNKKRELENSRKFTQILLYKTDLD